MKIDHTVPVRQIGAMLAELVREPVPGARKVSAKEEKRLAMEICIAMRDGASWKWVSSHPSPARSATAHSCGWRRAVACVSVDTGHAFTASGLLAGITQSNEEKLWQAMRSYEESVMLLDHLGRHYQQARQTRTAKLFFGKAQQARAIAKIIHDSVLTTENLSEDLRRETDPGA